MTIGRILKYLAFMAIGVVVGILMDVPFSSRSRIDRILDTQMTEWGRSRLVATAFVERAFIMGAVTEIFELIDGSGRRHEIMRFQHDDPFHIDKRKLKPLNDRVAYIVVAWKYAVTSDGGASWRVWDAKRDLPGWECCNSGLIQDVSMAPDGGGQMTLRTIPGRPGEVPNLYTKNFGRHWSPER